MRHKRETSIAINSFPAGVARPVRKLMELMELMRMVRIFFKLH